MACKKGTPIIRWPCLLRIQQYTGTSGCLCFYSDTMCSTVRRSEFLLKLVYFNVVIVTFSVIFHSCHQIISNLKEH